MESLNKEMLQDWYEGACDPDSAEYSAKTSSLIEYIRALEAQLAEQWIPVSERYPKLDERVLVWFGGDAAPYMDVWEYNGYNPYFRPRTPRSKEKIPRCVTHWQSLPAPPEDAYRASRGEKP